MHCGLPSPLFWEALRTWTVDVTLAKPDISLLRDHITLMSDIAKDWTSGPPGNYQHFVPFLYAFNLTIIDYTLRLFVNDHNIINNPSTLEDNCNALFAFTAHAQAEAFRQHLSFVAGNVSSQKSRSRPTSIENSAQRSASK